MGFFRKIPFVILIIATCTSIWFSLDKNQIAEKRVIHSDAYGYYAYLPAVFHHQDIRFTFYKHLSDADKELYWVSPTPIEGNELPKTSIGMAIIWTPAYLVAELGAQLFDYPTDGWSEPYHLAILLNGILALIIGLSLVYRMLLLRFSRTVSWITTLLLYLCTNLIYYSGPQGAFTHVYSFALIAAFFWYGLKWTKTPKLSLYLILGLLLGFISLIRPTNIIVAVIPLIVIIADKSWKSHLLRWELILALFAFLLPWLPQLYIWKLVAGQWLYYSYGDEQIYWLQPHILDGLFSFRNGWLIYTPIMVFALIGFISYRNWSVKWSLASAVFLVLHIYIVFSWWCWYYGDSLSIRPMIDVYAVLAMPLAFCVQWTLRQQILVWIPAFALSVTLIYNNWLQTWQYAHGYLSGSTMNQEAFSILFFNDDPPNNLRIIGAYTDPDTDRLRLGLPERTERDTIVERVLAEKFLDDGHKTHAGMPESIALMDDHTEYTVALIVNELDLETAEDRVIRASIEVIPIELENLELYFVLSFEADEGELIYNYISVGAHKLDLKENEWNMVELFVREPVDMPKRAYIKNYIWKKSGKQVYLRNQRVELINCPYTEPLIPTE